MTTAFAQPRSTSGLEGHAARIKDDMTKLILHAARTTPRTLQTQIGPSELGHPCLRKLAYKTLDHLRVNTDSDPLPSIIGTGGHSWFADAVTRCGNGRYLSETRVTVSGTISGSCDLLDTHTRTVIDLKYPGPTAMKKYRTEGPGDQYREQCHLYGLGFANLGYEPLHVAIVFIPRAGRLDGVHVWSEPWSRERAEACINRHATLVALLGALGADEQPGPALAQIPMTPSNCGWCEWALAGSADLAAGCPGDLKIR